MKFTCKLGIHDWNGCVCRACGERRDEGHNWKGCICVLCGKIRQEGHDFLNVELTCKQCKTVLDMALKEEYGETLARAMPMLLKELMSPLENSKKALVSLERIGWQPQSLEERMHVHMLHRDNQALVSLGLAAGEWLIKKIHWNTEFVAQVLGEIGASMTNSGDELKCRDSIVTALIQTMETCNRSYRKDPERSLALIQALGRIGDVRALPHFIAEMRNEYMDHHWNKASAETIVDVISCFGTEAVPGLVKELHNPRAHVPGLAVKALLKIGQPAVPELVKELKTGCRVGVRKVVIKILEELGWQPQAMEEKIPIWLDRKEFAELVKLGPPGTGALLGELNAQGFCEQSLRKDIIDALGATGDRAAVPTLVQILKERDAGWSPGGNAAAMALAKIGDRSAVNDIIRVVAEGNAHGEYFEALAQLSAEQAPALLLEILKTGEHWQRKAVAIALEKIGDRSTVPDLIEALARAEGEEKIHHEEYNAISNALFKFGHPAGGHLYYCSATPIVDGMQFKSWTKRRRDEINSRKG